MAIAHIRMHRRWFAGLVGLAVLMGSFVPQQSFAQPLIDYDADNDNLIEVDSLAKLNAIRYDLDGDGMASNAGYATAFPTPAMSMGCAAACEGYELVANLDFDASGDGEITSADSVLAWGEGANAGSGWQPIGTDANRFTATFDGNGHTISHLFINRTGTDNVGLFGSIGTEAVIRSVGLVGVNVAGDDNVGALVGENRGPIHASYATGEIRGRGNDIGGLVGLNFGTIRASYATGNVSGNNFIGGLVGINNSGAIINASYATGDVNGNSFIGGLVGWNTESTIRASYQPVGLGQNALKYHGF